MPDKNCYRKIVTFFLFLISVLCLSGVSSSQALIEFYPQQLNVGENENFTLDMIISSDVKISGAELKISYDPALLSITSIQEGDLFRHGGKSTIFSSGNIDNEPGTVTGIYSVIIGDEILPGPGAFATIALSSKDSIGIAELEIMDVLISNSAGDSLPVTIENAQIMIGDVNASGDEQLKQSNESQRSGQNSLITLVFAMVCLYLLKRK
ncbi:MAG: cohesin domain-containing protein [Methanolobus sp.]|nr:cohesin domain-containing protein [Methanolobus sp.]